MMTGDFGSKAPGVIPWHGPRRGESDEFREESHLQGLFSMVLIWLLCGIYLVLAAFARVS